MLSSRMRTARSLTVSRRILRMPPQPRMPPWQPRTPPSNHAPPTTTHAPPCEQNDRQV